MDITTYETLTGKQVSTTQEDYYEAIIAKTKSMLENILGYSLDAQSQASTRLFQFNKNDKYTSIDPFETITSVKLVNDDEDEYTFTTDDYRIHTQYGITKTLQFCNSCYQNFCSCYNCTQLEVVAEWEWDTLPTDLQLLWADMTTYYADQKNNIKSETLGTHSYTKGNLNPPETKRENLIVIGKYQGGNGQGIIIPTL